MQSSGLLIDGRMIDFGQTPGFGLVPLRGVPASELPRFLVPIRDGGLVTPLLKFGHCVPRGACDAVGVPCGFVQPRSQCPEGQAIYCP
jgi:hypothetical protein